MTLFRQSQLFSASLRTPPKEAKTVNHRLLVRGGYIRQVSAGIYSLLPLGYRVLARIQNIVREEMNAIGAQELLLPTLQPKSLLLETGRWATMDPPLFTLHDRHDSEYALGPTHEEIITDIARSIIHSHNQLPLAAYQIQTKFRNELRPSGGLLRLREFCMKDLYSFHATEEDLVSYYHSVHDAYRNIFTRCDMSVIPIAAQSGTIGGAVSHEFSLPAEAGEDTFAQCSACGFAANIETLDIKEGTTADMQCPACTSGTISFHPCIECGHTFQLGTKYSSSMKAHYTDAKGMNKPIIMGCYGIGISRLIAAIVETHHDNRGIIWPKEIAPYDIHVLSLQGGSDAERVAGELANMGNTVLFDDREQVSAGEKFADAELIGIPAHVIVSKRSLSHKEVEIRLRAKLDKSITVSHESNEAIVKAIEQLKAS